MTRMTPVRRYVSGMLLVLLISGCTTWQPYAIPTSGARELPAAIRVTRSDGQRFQVNKPAIEADTALVGLTNRREPVRIPLRDAVAMEQGRRNVGVVLGMAAIGLLVLVAAGLSSMEGCCTPG